MEKHTQEQFLKHIKELEKQNLYGGATDVVTPALAGTISGTNPFFKALLQKNPVATLLTGLGSLELGDYGGLPTTKKINEKTLYPDLKYLENLKKTPKKLKLKRP